MATLNLVPDPGVLVVQGGIFLVAMGVVKTLFVGPYLKVRERREAATVGSKDEAIKALAEADAISRMIEDRLAAAASEAKAARERVRDAATAKRDQLLAAATAEANAAVAAVERQIQQDVAAERTKVPGVVAQLTDEVYKLALA